jgi:hypothetical protein
MKTVLIFILFLLTCFTTQKVSQSTLINIDILPFQGVLQKLKASDVVFAGEPYGALPLPMG